MVKGGSEPRCCRVAEGAVSWEACGNVCRVVSAREVSMVAAIAGSGKRTGIVIVGVAQCTGHSRVCPRQRERSVVVVERRACPRRSVVALRAVGRELSGKVRRVRGVVVIGLMATYAGVRQRAVIAGCRGVALRARHGRVEAGQRERSVVVIEGRRGPAGCVVALRAIGWEVAGHVRRIIRTREVSLVAAVAGRRQ